MTETKTAIVTGASRGIGAGIAKRLAHDGFAMIVNYTAGAAAAETLVQEITQAGGKALAVQADVADPHAVRAMFATAAQAFGGVDVLVNNAGIQYAGPIAAMSDDEFDKMTAVNFKGAFNNLREAAARLRSGGRIINISSGTTKLRGPNLGVYAAGKAAVEVMSEVLSKELRGRNITVNTVAPGPCRTDLFVTGKSPELLEAMAQRSPLGRLGEPADIAAVVAMLAGPDGGWVNGEMILVNGGFF